jgi:hypothetical protein
VVLKAHKGFKVCKDLSVHLVVLRVLKGFKVYRVQLAA